MLVKPKEILISGAQDFPESLFPTEKGSFKETEGNKAAPENSIEKESINKIDS